MPILAQTHAGKVVALWGKALIRGTDGNMRVLKLGDMVQRGDVILTTQDGIVELSPQDGPRMAAVPPADDVDRVIASLENNDPTAATAATAGGDGGEMGPGLRVDRVVETVSFAANLPSSGESPSRVQETFDDSRSAEADAAQEPQPAPAPSPAPTTSQEPAPAPAVTTSSSITAIEEGPAVALGLTAPEGSVVLITQVPAVGEIRTADDALVVAGATLSAATLAGLRYLPPSEVDSSTPVGELTYSVSQDGRITSNGTTRIDLAAVNDAPVAQSASVNGLEDATLPIALSGADVDGQVSGVTIVSLPQGSHLWLADGTTPVTAGQTLTPAQAAQLLFQPAADFNGDAGIVFSVSDDSGGVSAPATLGLVITPVNDAPVGGADVVSTPINTAITLAVLTNDRDADGDALAVSAVELVDRSRGSVSINPDGTVLFTPASNVSGPAEIRYTVSDGQGGAATALATVHVGDAVSFVRHCIHGVNVDLRIGEHRAHVAQQATPIIRPHVDVDGE